MCTKNDIEKLVIYKNRTKRIIVRLCVFSLISQTEPQSSGLRFNPVGLMFALEFDMVMDLVLIMGL